MKMTIITTEKILVNTPEKLVLFTFSKPEADDGKNLHNRIVSFYDRKGRQYEKRFKNITDKMTDGELSLICDCKILYQSDHFLSLKRTYTIKKNRRPKFTVSEFDTWELKTGLPLNLYSFEPDIRHIKRHIKSAAKDRKTFRKLLKNFSPDDFSLTEGGTIIYIQNPDRGILIPFSQKSKFSSMSDKPEESPI